MSVIAARPIVTRIGDVLFKRLERLKAQLTIYAPFVEVLRPTRLGGYTPKHLQIVMTDGACERVPELDCPGNPPAIAWRQTWNIRCHVMPSEKDPTPSAEYCNVQHAAVVQAVVNDGGSRWWTFNELALDAEWESPEPIAADGSFVGVNVPLSVTFRVEEGNAYEVRA